MIITPLGGLGEIGMNCMMFSTRDSLVVVDCGLMFPDDELLGVDIVIPSFEPILQQKHKLKAIVLTHGHEDHIGALPWLLPYVDAPVYGSRFTLGLVENKLREHDLDRYVQLKPVKAGDTLMAGDLTFNFFPVCHSIINGFGLGIDTPAGRVVHSGDFKVDRAPLDGHATDMAAFARFAEPGVRLLLSDSTNAERDGFALTEREIMERLREIFSEASGRILITLFSSHIQRMQEVLDLAAAFGRKVAVNGKSLQRNLDLARDLGYVRVKGDTLVSLDEAAGLPDEQVVLLVTGSQGEPLSALTRMSLGQHRQLSLHPGDLVIMSSRFIPGNVKAITKVINRLYKMGAEVLYERVHAIHASGHAHREDLRLMFEAVKPEWFVPIHGEYRHLVKHSRLAVECGVHPAKALVVEDGQPITLEPEDLRVGAPIPLEATFVDGKGVGDVGETVLRERQLLSEEGLVIAHVVIDEETGSVLHGPALISKGLVFEQEYSHLLDDATCVLMELLEDIPRGQVAKLRDRTRSALRRYFRNVLGRDPVVVPVITVV
ncbi:MAG: ribonuclease J [Desulfovibrionaceae bacterium]